VTNLRSPEKWLEGFQQFMEADPVAPPSGLTEKVFSKIARDLNPPQWKVFLKLGAVHSVVGSLTLLICPQFGLGRDIGVMSYFMRLGPHGCLCACGMLFLGVSALASALLLRSEEIRALRRIELFHLSLLGLASMGAFLGLGAEVVMSLSLAWIAGSILGGIGSLELGWLIRRRLADLSSVNV